MPEWYAVKANGPDEKTTFPADFLIEELPFDSVVSFVVRSLPGQERNVLWSVPRSEFDAVGGRTQTVRVRLNPPGSIYNERVNVLDPSFGKLIDVGNARVRIGADVYNILVLRELVEARPSPALVSAEAHARHS